MGEPNPPAGTVLVADDAPFFRTLLKHALEEEGYQVVTANDGQQALDRLNNDPMDIKLVLVDLVMPKLNGFQLIEKLLRCFADDAYVNTDTVPKTESLADGVRRF